MNDTLQAKLAIITLGCAKNTVDSEHMLGVLTQAGFEVTEDAGAADVVIINTCGFIAAAREESINTILEATRLKKVDGRPKLVAAGCLAQKYHQELLREIPEIDAVIGTGDAGSVAAVIKQVMQGQQVVHVPPPGQKDVGVFPRYRQHHSPTAYLKIAEGCDHRCSFCAIPQMRGPYRSLPIATLVQEAAGLIADGAQELVLIAQDTSLYGQDLYGARRLPALIRKLAALEGLRWLRLMYVYPEHIDEDLIQVMREEETVCKYLDIPLQHANRELLRRMNRRYTKEDILALVHTLRRSCPDIALRTTFIVGFPGETEEQFQELLDLIVQAQFDWAGVFKYSREEGTPAARMRGQVSEAIKDERFHRAMMLQHEITRRRNQAFLHREITVLVEEENDEFPGEMVGRTHRQAPEIDGVVRLSGAPVLPGATARVRVTGVDDYDLLGEIIE